MLKINYGTTEENRKYILGYISDKRRINKKYSVIDIGGSMVGWTAGVADMIVDIQSSGDKSMSLDICNHHDWHKLLDLVEKNGKYDYAICTHTLEDIYDPVMALKWLPKIANSGIITMPSINTELCRLTSFSPWLGFIQHRWIFDQQNGKMLLIPKLGFLEHIMGPGMKYNHSAFEIQYEWHDHIPFMMFMDNFLGPNEMTVLEKYNNFIDNHHLCQRNN